MSHTNAKTQKAQGKIYRHLSSDRRNPARYRRVNAMPGFVQDGFTFNDATHSTDSVSPCSAGASELPLCGAPMGD
jgi:hypothetical protein